MHSAAPINRLPNELLLYPFQDLIDADIALADPELPYGQCVPECKPSRRHRTAWALCLTCKQFDAVARPLLYANIEIRGGFWESHHEDAKQKRHDALRGRVRRDFCRTMEACPELRRFCRTLVFHAQAFSHIARLKESDHGFFDNLRQLSIQLEFPWANDPYEGGQRRKHPHSEQIQSALRALRSLEVLVLIDERGKLRFEDLQEVVGGLHRLRRLELSGVTCPHAWNRELDAEIIMKHGAASDAAAAPPPGLEGTAHFTELCLKHCDYLRPDALYNFLRWAARLEVFELDRMGSDECLWPDLNSSFNQSWTFQVLDSVLRDHHSTIRELRVRQMGPQKGICSFNLHHYTALDTFQICMSGATEDLSGRPIARHGSDFVQLWLTPTLKRLVLQCSRIDDQHGIMYYLDEERVEWVAQFTHALAQLRCTREVGLETVEFIYNVDEGYVTNWTTDQALLMSQAEQILMAEGIQFVWPRDLPRLVTTSERGYD